MSTPKNLILIIVALWISGCSTLGYYSQSAQGHLSLWWNKRDITQVVQDPATDAQTRERLELVQRVRMFASEQLALPDNQSYKTYSDVGREYVVWNVFAAEEFSVEPYRWCYLIVGCVGYRGYYDERKAQWLAHEMSAQGYDTYVSGISAYSTLGWFSDPVLNTFLRWRESALAGTLFHELAHQVVYIKDDAAFNEAFATAVQRLGVLSWFAYHQQREAAENYLRLERQQNQFSSLLIETRNELKQVYEYPISDDQKRLHKEKAIDRLRRNYQKLSAQWGSDDPYSRWFDQPVNNARLSANLTYLERVPAFYALFLESNGEWANFFSAVKKLSENTQQDREQTLIAYAARRVDAELLFTSGYFSKARQSANLNLQGPSSQ